MTDKIIHTNSNVAIARRIQNVVQALRDEADNISPTNEVHPAPAMRKWANYLDGLSKALASNG